MAEDKKDITFTDGEEHRGATGGIHLEEVKPEIEPPLSAEEASQISEEEIPQPGRKVPKGKIPLQPAVIRLTFRLPGEALAYATGFEGWKLSEESLADIVEVYEALGIETDPRIQAVILPVIAYGGKFMEYQAWRRRGKPGDKRGEWTGGPNLAKGAQGETTVE